MSEIINRLDRLESALVTGQDNALWTIDDIATYFRRSKSMIRQKVINQPNFPSPIHIQGIRKPYWSGDHVKLWATSQNTTKRARAKR